MPTALFLSRDSSASLAAGPAAAPSRTGGRRSRRAAQREAIAVAADSALAAWSTPAVRDVALWDEVGRVYERRFGARPARAIVPTGELHYGALVEISAVALAQA